MDLGPREGAGERREPEAMTQRLSMALCPVCEALNAPEDEHCRDCGAPLVMRCPRCETINVRSRRRCHRCQVPLHDGDPVRSLPTAAAESVAGPRVPDSDAMDTVPMPYRVEPLPEEAAIRFDAGPAGGPWSPYAPAPDDAQAEPAGSLSLRGEGLPASRPAARPTAAVRLNPSTLPATAREALWSVGPAALQPPLLGAVAPHAPDPRRAKAERRAKVRQRQLRAQRGVQPDGETLPSDVLLLESHVESRATIGMVLEAFGFHPRIAASAAEALAMATRRRYAVVLLGIGPQRDETPALCQRLRALPGLAHTPVIAIGDARHHMDRVRMQLAGAAETLLRPVDRGALARCLQAHGIALPRDPRLGGPPPA